MHQKENCADSFGCCSEMPSIWLDLSFRQTSEWVLYVLTPRLRSCKAACPCTHTAVHWQLCRILAAHSQQRSEMVQHECTSVLRKLYRGVIVFHPRGVRYVSLFLFQRKAIFPMLCLLKLVYPRRSPRELLSSSWRAFNLLGKQWSQIFFNVALILLGKHLFTLGLTRSKWEVCMCPLISQLTECEILGP